MNKLPFVSIIIPCRNEENYIAKCIDSIITSDYMINNMEILVVDGMSNDKTKEIIERYSRKYPFIRLVQNIKKIVSTALNIGIREARGQIIIRMDAHNIYDSRYISQCVHYLQEYNADNVGGIWITLPGRNTIIGESIAIALSSPFGAGNAYYRIGAREPKFVDTVPFGCYRREVFDKIGFFDEELVRNQDDEFNSRLIKNGGKILLVPDIISFYYARDSMLKLWKLYYQYGYFKPLVALKLGKIMTVRQLIPALFVSGLIISGLFAIVTEQFLWPLVLMVLFYIVADLFFSVSICKQKGLKFLTTLPFVFIVLHFSYGVGYLKGILDFCILKKHTKNKISDVPLTR